MTKKLTHAELENLKATYVQECDQDREGFQDLQIWLDTQGAGKYFVLKTKRWAMDDIEELIDILKDYKSRCKGILDADT